MIREETARTDGVKSNVQQEFMNVRAKLSYHQDKFKKEIDLRKVVQRGT